VFGWSQIPSSTATHTEGLFQFLREVEDRAVKMGWMDGIIDIPVDEKDTKGDEKKDGDSKEY